MSGQRSQDQTLAASLERLRGNRNRADRAADLGGDMAAAAKGVRSRARAVGGVAAAWGVCVPDELRGACELVGCANGVVTVRVGRTTLEPITGGQRGLTSEALAEWLRAPTEG